MLFKTWEAIKTIHFKYHLIFAFLLRSIFIFYGVYHDSVSVVPYTDVDYKVFTDASRYTLNGFSPYNRHTYRYTPLVAILLIPNFYIHHTYGKFLFSVIDLMVAFLIRLIVKNSLNEYECYKQRLLSGKTRDIQSKQQSKFQNEKIVNISVMMWLYNPMTIAIATRGNCDALAGFLVLATLYFLQCKKSCFIAGLLHGISVHIRLYPIAYSLTLFMYLSKYSFYSTDRWGGNVLEITQENVENKMIQTTNKMGEKELSKKERKTIFKKEYILYLIPNRDQIKLICGFLLSFTMLTMIFYYLYGYKFLHETYIYHLIRKDSRHNFSLYFYLQYLTAGVKNIGLWQKTLTVLPQAILLIVLSVRYGLNKFSLNFSLLTETIVMVAFNSVLTSQYFVWVMALFPLCLWQIKMSPNSVGLLIAIWVAAQGSWLLPAYFLEFHGHNTFLFIWVQGVSFFCANIAILGRLIGNFKPPEKTKIL